MDFTESVKRQMTARGVKVGPLAKEMGISAEYLYKLLARQKRWNETTMTRACEALGLRASFVSDEPAGQDAAVSQ